MVSMRNVAGEILGAQAAMEYALEHGMKEITIYHDYNGLAEWCVGGWKTNKSGTKAYKETYLEVSKHVNIRFVKVKGHSNVFYNDVVDALAKQALGIEDGIKKNIAEHIEKIKELRSDDCAKE
jgi:ribonuclease HI